MQLLDGKKYVNHEGPNNQYSVLHLLVICEVDVEPGQSLPACTKLVNLVETHNVNHQRVNNFLENQHIRR